MKKNLVKILSMVLVVIMVASLFAGCKKEEVATPIVVGYSPFNEKFSPFFSETAYDADVYAMTQLGLLTNDRQGAMITNGINGETINYHGTDYTYYGPADLVITENDDGTVYYDFTLRTDIKFSDGEPLTIDDVIFSLYVLCDPTYDGNSSLFSLPILGMDDYRGGMSIRGDLIAEAGPDGYTANDYYTEEQYNQFWDYYNNNAGADFAQSIIDYCIDNYISYAPDYIEKTEAEVRESEDLQVLFGMTMWGYGDAYTEGATAADYWQAILDAYDGDVDLAVETESAGKDLAQLTTAGLGGDFAAGVKTGNSADNIAGIQRIDDSHLRIVLTEVDATAIYQLGVAIAPMHYYGDKAQYDYANNKFGFPKGDLSLVRAKTSTPMGAGPYKFIKYENGVVYFEANENYFKGAPKTKYINFQQCMSDDDKLNGVVTGTIDLTDPSFSKDTVKAITEANGGAGVTGSVITTNTVDNLGYGYIGISAKAVNVGGDIGSEASKNLRKAFATVFSAYRQLTVESYSGERASVINYPISNTSWAAPQATDDGYKVAFSVDVDGNDIYTSDMDADAKYAAALQAALGFFEAAGYTVEDGKLTAAPEGAKLEYEIQIPADGKGDHPSFMLATESSKALATIGMNLIVTDLSNSSELWTGIEADQVDMWCAAWGATPDPDMYQIYYSDLNGDGEHAGGSNYMYDISDPELDQLIMDARRSFDTNYRKAMYKACLDIIVDWAVEVPVYQRQNAIIFSTERLNIDSVTPDITTFYGWMYEVENITRK